MYDNIKCQGHPLTWWRDFVFHGMFSLGELYRMVKFGVKLESLQKSK